VVLVFEGQRHGTTIEGSFHARLFGERETLRAGRFIAKRADSTHRAA
jgi:hypothetical protein